MRVFSVQSWVIFQVSISGLDEQLWTTDNLRSHTTFENFGVSVVRKGAHDVEDTNNNCIRWKLLDDLRVWIRNFSEVISLKVTFRWSFFEKFFNPIAGCPNIEVGTQLEKYFSFKDCIKLFVDVYLDKWIEVFKSGRIDFLVFHSEIHTHQYQTTFRNRLLFRVLFRNILYLLVVF